MSHYLDELGPCQPPPIVEPYTLIGLLADAGLQVEDGYGNWEQLKEYAVKLTKKDSAGRGLRLGFTYPRPVDTVAAVCGFGVGKRRQGSG